MKEKIRLRVTEIESFLKCPRLYQNRHLLKKIGQIPKREKPYFFMGKVFHVSRQSKAFGELYRKSQSINIHDDLELKFLISINNHPLQEECVEYLYEVQQEYEDEVFIISGTPDFIGMLPDNSFRFIDYKTAKSKWGDDALKERSQWYSYPAMFAIETNIPDDTMMEFVYLVYTKKKGGNADPQIISVKKTAGEMKKLFTESIKKIKVALLMDYFPQIPLGGTCYYCPYRQECYKSETQSFSSKNDNTTKTPKDIF